MYVNGTESYFLKSYYEIISVKREISKKFESDYYIIVSQIRLNSSFVQILEFITEIREKYISNYINISAE